MWIFPLDTDNFIVHQKFLEENDSNPIFVSHPRSGGHYTMACLEEYFNKTVLCDSYVGDEVLVEDVLLLHSHDGETGYPCYRQFLSIERKNVVILVREPVDVIFSWLSLRNLHKNKDDVIFETENYKQFIYKWLVNEKFTENKLVISYDKLKRTFEDEFSKLVRYLGGRINKAKMKRIKSKITEGVIYKKHPHTTNKMPKYNIERSKFTKKFGGLINDTMGDSYLLFT
jgi:hypothetical protein